MSGISVHVPTKTVPLAISTSLGMGFQTKEKTALLGFKETLVIHRSTSQLIKNTTKLEYRLHNNPH
jgi:hypothetical protein